MEMAAGLDPAWGMGNFIIVVVVGGGGGRGGGGRWGSLGHKG